MSEARWGRVTDILEVHAWCHGSDAPVVVLTWCTDTPGRSSEAMGRLEVGPLPARGEPVRSNGAGVDIMGRTLATGRLVASAEILDLKPELQCGATNRDSFLRSDCILQNPVLGWPKSAQVVFCFA